LMAQLSTTMQVLFISLALTTVVSVRVDDEQPQQVAAAQEQLAAAPQQQEQLVAAAQEQAAAVQFPEVDVEQQALALGQEGAALHGGVAYGNAGAEFPAKYGGNHHIGAAMYGYGSGYHAPIVPTAYDHFIPGGYGSHDALTPSYGPPDALTPSYAKATLTRTAGALRNTQLAMQEAQAVRSSAHANAASQILGAQYQSQRAVDMAQHEAVRSNGVVVTQGSTQTTAQRHAQDVALAHSLEAAQAHSKMVQSQEAEKIHAQEAKLAHAEAVTEKRAIEVHVEAEKKIKDIEMLRARGIHELNVRADREVAATHGTALSGLEGATVKGKDDIVQIRAENPAMHEKINAEVQSDATKWKGGLDNGQVEVQGFAHTHPDALPADYATKGLGGPVQGVEHMQPMYPGGMGYVGNVDTANTFPLSR
jgi:hypothetical protein